MSEINRRPRLPRFDQIQSDHEFVDNSFALPGALGRYMRPPNPDGSPETGGVREPRRPINPSLPGSIAIRELVDR